MISKFELKSNQMTFVKVELYHNCIFMCVFLKYKTILLIIAIHNTSKNHNALTRDFCIMHFIVYLNNLWIFM